MLDDFHDVFESSLYVQTIVLPLDNLLKHVFNSVLISRKVLQQRFVVGERLREQLVDQSASSVKFVKALFRFFELWFKI